MSVVFVPEYVTTAISAINCVHFTKIQCLFRLLKIKGKRLLQIVKNISYYCRVLLKVLFNVQSRGEEACC